MQTLVVYVLVFYVLTNPFFIADNSFAQMHAEESGLHFQLTNTKALPGGELHA
jgi:ABC-type sugar transport system substrate-binding protein